MPLSYTILLNSRGGYKTVGIEDVYAYERVSEADIPDYLYRDTGLSVPLDGFTIVSGGDLIEDDDLYTHTPPRQASKDRFAHIFYDNTTPTPVEIGFIWDDYVISVSKTNG